VIDRRLGATFSVEEAERFVPFLADAIAVTLGYGAHPREDDEAPLPRAPHVRPIRLRGVAVVQTEDMGDSEGSGT
jgi:hypothetical protein